MADVPQIFTDGIPASGEVTYAENMLSLCARGQAYAGIRAPRLDGNTASLPLGK